MVTQLVSERALMVKIGQNDNFRGLTRGNTGFLGFLRGFKSVKIGPKWENG